jgi:hypothetical protein
MRLLVGLDTSIREGLADRFLGPFLRLAERFYLYFKLSAVYARD